MINWDFILENIQIELEIEHIIVAWLESASNIFYVAER